MGTIGANYGKYQQYKYAARETESQGRAQRTAYNKQADNLEREARTDTRITGLNMTRMRENQNTARATVRASQGASGLTTEGSGSQAETAIADTIERTISDMSLGNAISDQNKRYAADTARYQGDLGYTAARNTAAQYRALGSGALGSAWIHGLGTAAGGAYDGTTGALQAYNLGNTALSFVPGSMAGNDKQGNTQTMDYILSLLGTSLQNTAK